MEEAVKKTLVNPKDVKKYKISINQMCRVVNRSTFKCPFCAEANLERKGLLEHTAKKHKGKAGVCPICVA